MRVRDWARRVVNAATLATPAGLVVALAGGARLRPGPHGTVLAVGYRGRWLAPRAPALTIGDVVLLRLDAAQLAARPGLLQHEVRHAVHWACWGGLLGFPLAYAAASGWSVLRCGDAALANAFERRAGLVDGGYLRGHSSTRPAGPDQ